MWPDISASPVRTLARLRLLLTCMVGGEEGAADALSICLTRSRLGERDGERRCWHRKEA